MDPLQQGKKERTDFYTCSKTYHYEWQQVLEEYKHFVSCCHPHLHFHQLSPSTGKKEKEKSIVAKYVVYFDNLNGRHQVI